MTRFYAVAMNVSYFNEGPANNYFIQSQFSSAPFLSLSGDISRSSGLLLEENPM